MTIDHDAIAARVRCDITLGLNICAAYLDLYDEVKRLRLGAAHAEHTTDAAISEVRRLEAERDALWAALEEIADGLKGIARDIQIGPDDEGREIYDMVQAMQWDARQALKGHNQ